MLIRLKPKNELAWAEDKYSTLDSSVLEAFFANLVSLPVHNVFSFEFEGVNYSHKKLFSANIAKKNLKYCSLKLAVMIQLKNSKTIDFLIIASAKSLLNYKPLFLLEQNNKIFHQN